MRPLYEIAKTIKQEAKANPRASWVLYAAPYVDALASLSTTQDDYYADSGESVVRYCLANLSTWRGETARAVKAELKAHLA